MNTKEYPRVLVISNNSFSKTNSNGRTLGNLFKGWPKDCLAEFCILPKNPDFAVCDNYFCITDREILKSLTHFRSPHRLNLVPEASVNISSISKKYPIKNTLTQLVRNILWSISSWETEELLEWINAFSPELLLVVNTDAYFMLNIANSIKDKYKIPMVMFNTEGFYFFNHIYADYEKSNLDFFVFPIFKHIYRHVFKKTAKNLSYIVHQNQLLKRDFDKEFDVKSECIFTATFLMPKSDNIKSRTPKFTYIGNLGIDRDLALIEIGRALQEINIDYRLEVYGNASNLVKNRFSKEKGIDYKGFVSYCEVPSIIWGSTIIFHAESQNPVHEESLRYGFSTKIADSLASGIPFVIYSSPDIAGYQYVRDNKAGWCTPNKTELKTIIQTILDDSPTKNAYVDNALNLAKKNHDIEKNSSRFKDVLMYFSEKCQK